MAKPDDAARIEAALQLIHHWARAKRVLYGEQALLDAQSLGFDTDDILAFLVGADASCVWKCEDDRDFPDRTAVVMRIRTEELRLYVKVSLRIEKDHDVTLRSFHRWGM